MIRPHDPAPRRRNTTRWREWTYNRRGAYFVTICTHQKLHTLGRVVGDTFYPSQLGEIVEAALLLTPDVRPTLRVGRYQVMPNHLHAIVWLRRTGPDTELDRSVRTVFLPPSTKRGMLRGPEPQSVSGFVRGLKAAATRCARAELQVVGPIWQRGFHDHVIRLRDPDELRRIRRYIRRNPKMWRSDRLNRRADLEPEYDDEWAV